MFLLLALAPPASAGSTWQTATDVTTPIVDANISMSPGEVRWYAAIPSRADSFVIDITTDGPVDIGLYLADAGGQPNMTWFTYSLDGVNTTVYETSVVYDNTSKRFLVVSDNSSSGAGANITLTVGLFPLKRITPGANVTARISGFWGTPLSFPEIIVFDDALVGGQDGLWDLNVTFDIDNSTLTGSYIVVHIVCNGEPYCGPSWTPATYTRDIRFPAGTWFTNMQLNSFRLAGVGASRSLQIADSSQGLTYLKVSFGFSGMTPPNGSWFDVSCTIRATRAPLPASNADDYVENATLVPSHFTHSGTLSLDDNLVDWYTFNATGSAVDINLTLNGTLYNDGSSRTGYLLIEAEAILFDAAGRPLSADNNQLDRNSPLCINCVAGGTNMHLEIPATVPTGAPVYLSIHVLHGPYNILTAIASYSVLVRLPGVPPVAVQSPFNVTLDEDTTTTFDLATWFFDAEGDHIFHGAGVVAGALPLATSFSGDNLTLAPGPNAWGNATVRVTGGDGYSGQVAEVFINVTVLPVNDAPVSDGVKRYLLWDQGTDSGPIDLATSFSDVDDDLLTFALDLPPGFTATSCGTGCFVVHVPDNGTYGNFSATARATDLSGLTATLPVQFVIYHVNQPPMFSGATPPSPVTASHASTLTLSAAASDPDGDPLDLRWEVDGVSQAGNGSTISISGLSPGNHSARLTAWDGNASVTAFWLLVITNAAPTLVPAPAVLSLQVSHGASTVFSVDATDPDGDLLTFAWWVDGAPAASTGPSLTVASLRVGGHDVRVSVFDGTDEAVATWIVDSTDSPPLLSPTPTGPSITKSHRAVLQFSVDASDADGDPITFEWLIDGKVVGGATEDALDVTDLAPGNHTVEIRATSNRVRATFAWSVWATNAPPEFAVVDPTPGAITRQAGEPAEFHVTATDADGDPLQYMWYFDGRRTATTGPDYSIGATTPPGEYVVRLVATDSEGASVSAEWTVTIEQPPPEAPPVEPPSTPGLGAVAVLAGLAVAALAAGWAVRRRQG